MISLAVWALFYLRGEASESTHLGLAHNLEVGAWSESPDVLAFAVIGDFGTGSVDQYRVAYEMAETYQEFPYSHLLTVGDNVYGGDVVDRAPDVIGKPYGQLFTAGVEFRPSLGNHDVDDSDDLEETLTALGMPSRYYQFNSGPIDFFALDSNQMDSEQLEWLSSGLICSDKAWQVVYLHHPLYSSGKHGSDIELRRKLEPILVAGGADVVFAGHDHDYQRSIPQEGIVHIVTGGAAKLRDSGSSHITEYSKSELHFVFVEAVQLNMDVRAINVDGEIIDQVSIKPRDATTPCNRTASNRSNIISEHLENDRR